jgi:short-subunit dehydrogenase
MDRVIIITGGTSGYGYATAELFAKAGDRVIVVARTAGAVEETKKTLGVDGFAADITKEDDWIALRDYVAEKYGCIDILINNAGGAIVVKPFLEQTSGQITDSIDLNLTGMMWGCKVFAPMMVEKKSGTIINVASACATQCWPNFSVYAAAKAGMLSFSKSLYVELRSRGIRVTCMIPGAGESNFCVNAGIEPYPLIMKSADFGQAIFDVCNLPMHIVVEDMTVWGIDQELIPL